MLVKPLALVRELDKSLRLTPKQLKQLKRSTLRLAEAYDRLLHARLVPAATILNVRHLWALPQLLRLAAGKLDNWAGADYRRYLSDRNLRSYYLTALCVYVSAVTGRPHYSEIASLLTEIAHWLNISRVFDSEGVRKDSVAFKRRNKELMWLLEMEAEFFANASQPARS